MSRGAGRRADRWAAAEAAAHAVTTGGVMSRAWLRALGVDRRAVAREIAAGRWASHGLQTVAVHTGPLDEIAKRWRAVWEVGVGIAVIDGVTALQAAGMVGFTEPLVHVSVPHTATTKAVEGVRVHKVRRRDPLDVITVGLPRSRPGAAAIRAAHWAVSDRQAAVLLAMPVQQRLVRGADLAMTASRVHGRTRRALIAQLVADVADGAHSLGELDFASMCRRWHVPPPTRQQLRVLPNGRAYLDAWWDDVGLCVEIDGSGHEQRLAPSTDRLRQNDVTLGDARVLRMDLFGLRLYEPEFMAQIRRGLGLPNPPPLGGGHPGAGDRPRIPPPKARRGSGPNHAEGARAGVARAPSGMPCAHPRGSAHQVTW